MDFVSPVEVDCLIKSLRRQRIDDLGKEQWLEQHVTVIKLNQQCVLEARTEGREEITRDLIVEHGKTPVLVQELFSIFVWKKTILPNLSQKDSVVVYSLGYHELILLNLLELILYNGNGCESLEDNALDLVDYCVQSATQLIGLVHSGFLDQEDSSKEVSPENMDYKLGIHSISLIYYLIDKLASLPLSVASRLIRFHDTPCLLSEILHCRPWQKRSAKGFEKFVEGKWTVVYGEDIQKVSKTEAQCWFALRQLLFNNQVMQSYDWNDFRCREISKCVGLLHDVLLDQLTPLVPLKQHLATMSIQKPTHGGQSKKTAFLLEEIPELQNEYLREIEDFGQDRLVELQSQFFNDKTTTSTMARRLNEAYNIEKILELQEDEKKPDAHKCAECFQEAEKKCSNCQLVFYCSRQCQLKHWTAHKSFCKANTKKSLQ